MDTRVAAGGTLIRRYALALTPARGRLEAALTAASIPPLSGGPSSHGSAAAHALIVATSLGGHPCSRRRPEPIWPLGSHSEQGERTIERLLSASITCRLQKRPLFAYLADVLQASIHGDPIPALA